MISAIIIMVAAVGLIFWKISGLQNNQAAPQDSQSLLMMQQQISQLQETVNNRLGETSKTFREQQKDVETIVREVSMRMAKVEEVSRQVLTETSELQKLQQILKNPKQRGVLGEYFLETLLKNALPPESFQMQYRFADGEIVDAAVFIKEKIVPIDSKFSLENYNRFAETGDEAERIRLEKLFINDLKERVKETAKYIRPQEGTMEFAFMFIPHEAIYFDLLNNKIGAQLDEAENIIQRAAAKYRVLVVSPTSFLAYLQTVVQGLRALQIEEQAKEIVDRVRELGRHLGTYEQHMQSMGKNLGTVVNQYNKSYQEFRKIDKDIIRITGEGNDIDPISLEGPKQ
ncbi:MAG: DNA recombination protein RmuC [Patescibacteria group bacterium]